MDKGQKTYGNYEIARLFHVTPGTVNKWFKKKKIPTFRTVGGHFRVLESDLFALLKSMGMPIPPDLAAKTKTRYLIVDDEAMVRRLVRRLLERMDPGAEIFEAVDGYEAGYKTHQLKPHLVILDLRLPCLDGIKVCRLIRRDKEMDKVKILAITAYHPERTRSVILKAGANAFLAKPFKNEEFERVVKSLLPFARRPQAV